MEITLQSENGSRIQGIPTKPLDNPSRTKPASRSGFEASDLLAELLAAVPADLEAENDSEFPLLDALAHQEAIAGRDLARGLCLVGADVHSMADERRSAEYLLRNRHDVVAGRRSALSLLGAANCAAEMDVRRIRGRETLISLEELDSRPAQSELGRLADPSVGEFVVEYLYRATGARPASDLTHDRLLDAVTVAMELSERHARRGLGPSVLGMRSDARKDARLVTRLREDFGDDIAARGLARLLIGPDGSPIETSLLYWAAIGYGRIDEVPAETTARWPRELIDADPILRRVIRSRRNPRRTSRRASG